MESEEPIKLMPGWDGKSYPPNADWAVANCLLPSRKYTPQEMEKLLISSTKLANNIGLKVIVTRKDSNITNIILTT
jgi:hypothetical protein